MPQVIPGRFTAETQENFVVFLIGMRVNQFWAFSKWVPTAQAMVPMLKSLYQHPEKGFLGQEMFFRIFPFEVVLISYWRSFEQLEYFARNPDDPHFGAWKRFNQAIGSDGNVGIWHETYKIQNDAIWGVPPVANLVGSPPLVLVLTTDL